MARQRKPVKTFPCPHCGAEVRVGASACPECGSDEETGWSASRESFATGGYGDEDDFDYDEFVREEFASESQRGLPEIWKWVVVVLLISMLAAAVGALSD